MGKLDSIKPKIVKIVINHAEMGYEDEFNIKMPTIQEWQDVYMTVEFPPPPKPFQRMKDGKKEDFIDWNDPDYLRKKDAATDLLAMRRVTHALIGGGDFAEDFKGLSLEAATDVLMEKADRAILNAIYQALIRLVNGMRGGVEAKKATFQGNSVHGASNADSDPTS
jgi:hypothetical protein